jgi:hypothetical protein
MYGKNNCKRRRNGGLEDWKIRGLDGIEQNARHFVEV